MGHHAHNPYGADARASSAIDRKREKERRYMLQSAYKNAEELSIRLVQRLLDAHIIETSSDSAIREVFEDLLKKISDLEEFELQFKIAPVRKLTADPNVISLYLTQYIIEDLIDHSKIMDIFGDDQEIYNAVESVMKAIRPS
ncbi:MAG: hypothetical protein KAJ60_01750 [Desulfobulbaceae bacterium]|nr:hypothetical protein [Desulfobulbaceae bacterium]MCK5339763.1 hypothetical protein [Desulfobulbaceae bacterium]MCK5404041.1 hypothetical protein [Desulfobulbaceae bacterium]